MSEHPVYFAVGSQRVRVGTARATQDGGFVIDFGGAFALGPSAGPSRSSGASSGGGGGGAVFPNYGRSKGQHIFGAQMRELEYYAANARKSIADPSKARWREKEEALLAALEAEIARQNGGEGYTPPRNDGPPVDDSELPF